MKREVCKFLSGSFAALAYAHAAYAVATSRDIINEPVFLGKRLGCWVHVDRSSGVFSRESGARLPGVEGRFRTAVAVERGSVGRRT